MEVRNIRLIGVRLLLLVIASLYEMGYEKHMHGLMFSKNEVLIEFILTNKDTNEQEKIEIKEVFDELAIKNKLDPKIFKVKVSNYNRSGW